MRARQRFATSIAFVATAAMATCALGCLQGPRHRRQQMYVATVAPTPTQESLETPYAAPQSKELTLEEAKATSTPMIVTKPGPATTSTTIVTSDGPLEVPNGATPAIAYAEMTGAQCEAELKKRGVGFTDVATAQGVDRPIRITGKLHGVEIHGLEKDPKLSVYEIADCRLALALDDFTAILAQHDVVEAVHFSIYRPGKGNGKKKHSQHEAALAIDLGTMIKKDGTKLSVEHDWHGAIGWKSCGPSANEPSPKTKEAIELHEILCKAYDARLFNVMLTPNYNKPHYNHFHLEVTRGVKWFLLR